MTHDEAAGRDAVERYLLGELQSAERAEFEEHFFQCPECAEAVRTGAAFAANARAVFRERAAVRRRWGVFGVLARPAYAYAAALSLLLVLGYEELVRVPRLRGELSLAGRAQAYPAFVLRTATRGEGQILTVPAAARFIGLSIDLPPGPGYAGYTARIESADGSARLTVPAAPPSGAAPEINLLLPASIPGGRYGLILLGTQTGSQPAELGRYEFTIRFE